MFDHVWPMWCQGVHWLHNLLDHLHFDSDFTWPTGRVHVHVTQDRLERIHHRLSSYRRLWSSMIWPDSSMFVGDLTIFKLWIHHWKLHDFPIDSKCPCQFRDFPAMLAGEYEDICQGCLIFFAAIWKRVARWWWKLKKNHNFFGGLWENQFTTSHVQMGSKILFRKVLAALALFNYLHQRFNDWAPNIAN